MEQHTNFAFDEASLLVLSLQQALPLRDETQAVVPLVTHVQAEDVWHVRQLGQEVGIYASVSFFADGLSFG
jgi:hypothetical protein